MNTKICSQCKIEKSTSEFHNHKHHKDGLTSQCKSCIKQNRYDYFHDPINIEKARQRAAKYYSENKEKCNIYNRNYAINNRDKVREIQKNFREREKQKLPPKIIAAPGNKICTKCHIEKPINDFHKAKLGKFGVKSTCKECGKIYRQENIKHIIERSKQYRQNNKSKLTEYVRKYRKTDRGKAITKSIKNRRRAKELNSLGDFNGKQILELFAKQKGICIYCKNKLIKSGKDKYHIDHIQPISKGGSNDISNIQLLCPSCNRRKSNKTPEEFAQQFGMFI